MSAVDIALEQIKVDEGYSKHVYVCPAGMMTIGYGRNVDSRGGPGLSESEASWLLANDIGECEADLKKVFSQWDSISEQRKSTLINLRYQLGPTRFRLFRKMIAAIEIGDWATAGAELSYSNLMKQTPARTGRRVRELEQG